ncbi:putative pentatricopeptide repeat-containing protein [Camellia lanceoleosa]|uniref:Pentatricopeptide repeat-containing protein n=1 Tax=Camellia lanceoleosa TaxID=1840588 RepID=A0ACC0FE03_9ERIC|nr:putative pentatricopeptide repeat-containing protein [Camellia lanceoleosa]
MIWSWSWKSLHSASQRIIKTKSFSSIHSLLSPIECSIHKIENFSTATTHYRQVLPKTSSRTLLTPQTVHCTLHNCPSDLISLSFFLWCARQPHYFHDRGAFDHMANVVSRLARQLGTVKGLIKQLEGVGCVTKPQTLLLLLRIFWHGGMFNLVFEAFEEMFNHGYTPNTFARNIVMDALFKIGLVDVALRVFKETQDPNFLTFSIAISNLCKLSDLMNIQDVLKEMLRKGYCLNSGTFSMVLNCFCKMGRLAEALQLLGLMITLGIPTSVSVWSILIDGYCKSDNLVMAGYLLEKMIEAGCSPNVVTCTSLIKGFMDSQMPGKALCILSTMESKGCSTDLVLCNVLIDCLSKMGRCDDALDVFFSLPKRKLVPDSYTLCSIMSAIFMSRQFDLLPILISGLAIQADLVVCNSLLSYFCRAGYPSGAVEFYNDMIDRGFIPDGYSYSGLLSGLCGTGRIGEAVRVYYAIVRNNFCLDPHIHTIIIDGLISSGKFHRAIRLFRKAVAEKYPLDVVSYTVAIQGLFRGGRTGEARILYNQMKEVGVAPNAYTYNVMLSGFCRERDIEMVIQILQDMVDSGIELDCNAFYMIKNLLLKSWYSRSTFNQFIEMGNSTLVSDKAIGAVLLKGLALGANVGANLVDVLEVDASGSNDICDVAAAVDGCYFLRDKFACCLFEDALPLHVVDLDDENFEKGCQYTFDLHMENIDISFA